MVLQAFASQGRLKAITNFVKKQWSFLKRNNEFLFGQLRELILSKAI
jgi:hypothetical protein